MQKAIKEAQRQSPDYLVDQGNFSHYYLQTGSNCSLENQDTRSATQWKNCICPGALINTKMWNLDPKDCIDALDVVWWWQLSSCLWIRNDIYMCSNWLRGSLETPWSPSFIPWLPDIRSTPHSSINMHFTNSINDRGQRKPSAVFTVLLKKRPILDWRITFFLVCQNVNFLTEEKDLGNIAFLFFFKGLLQKIQVFIWR